MITPSGRSSTDLLSEIRQHVDRYHAVNMTDQAFDLSHEAFERSSDQQTQIRQSLTQIVSKAIEQVVGEESRDTEGRQQPKSIFSVGCGSGILDLPLLAAMHTRQIRQQPPTRVRYVGLEPNPVAANRFQQDFASLDQTHTKLKMLVQPVEQLRTDERFDLVHVVHAVYYFKDPAATLHQLRRLLKPGGRLVIYQAPKGDLNHLSDCFWEKRGDREIWYSDQVHNYLQRQNISFARERIDAEVDVTECFKMQSEAGRHIVNFILQRQCNDMSETLRRLVLQYLRSIGTANADRFKAAHPVDVYTIETQPADQNTTTPQL